MQSHCPQSVPLGLLHLTNLQEFLLGGLASHGRSELPPGWLLPAQHRWPSLHSHLDQLSGWWWPWQPPHLSQLLSFLYPPLQLALSWGFSYYLWSWGVHQCWGFLCLHMDLGPCLHLLVPLVFPLSRCYFHSSHAGILKERVSQSEAREVSWVMWHLLWMSISMTSFSRAYFCCTSCFPNNKRNVRWMELI